jgi:hypothetical protein
MKQTSDGKVSETLENQQENSKRYACGGELSDAPSRKRREIQGGTKDNESTSADDEEAQALE